MHPPSVRSLIARTFAPVVASMNHAPLSESSATMARLPSSLTSTWYFGGSSADFAAGSASFLHAPALHTETPLASCLTLASVSGAALTSAGGFALLQVPVARSTATHAGGGLSVLLVQTV